MGLGALVCLKIGAPFYKPTMHSCISLNTLSFSLSVRLKQNNLIVTQEILLQPEEYKKVTIKKREEKLEKNSK